MHKIELEVQLLIWHACYGKKKIVKMMVNKAKSFKLDLEARENENRTGYEIAKSDSNFKIINILEQKKARLH